jgi:hypothetical protein
MSERINDWANQNGKHGSEFVSLEEWIASLEKLTIDD